MRGSSTWVAVATVTLFLLGSLPTGSGQAGDGVWGFTDPSNDVSANPSQTPADFKPAIADIRSFSILREDETEMVMALRVGPFERLDGYTDTSLSDVMGELTVTFSFQQLADYKIRVQLNGDRYQTDVYRTAYQIYDQAYFTITPGSGSTRYSYLRMDVVPAEGLFRFYLPKNTLLGIEFTSGCCSGPRDGFQSGGPSGELEPIPLAKGSLLSQFEARAVLDEKPYAVFSSPQAIRYEDSAPDSGPSSTTYAIATGFANQKVALTGARPKTPGINPYIYGPGLNQTFEFHLENKVGPKRLLKLTYDFMEPQEAQGFSIFGPASVSVPEGQVRNYTLFFKSPEGDHAPLRVRILGQSLGTSDLAALILTFENGTVLDAAHNTIHLFARTYPPSSTDTCVQLGDCMGQGVLSARAAPPGLKREGLVYPGDSYGSNYMEMDMGVGTPFAFLNNSAIEVKLHFVATERDMESAQMQVSLRYSGSNSYFNTASTPKTGPVTQAGTTYTFKLPVPDGALVQEAPGRFSLGVNARMDYSSTSQWESLVNRLGVSVEQSLITLPLTVVPEEFRKDAVRSPFQIGTRGERDDWINPGKAHLFNLTVLNFDAVDQRLRLETSQTGAKEWNIEVLPAAEFDMTPGRTITAGIMITAPTDAGDGEVVKVRVNATSDNNATVGVTFGLTSLFDNAGTTKFRDQRGDFRVDRDDQDAIRTPPKESPGWSLLATLLGASLALGRVARVPRRL